MEINEFKKSGEVLTVYQKYSDAKVWAQVSFLAFFISHVK